MINFCFLCDNNLNNSNSNKEHIIPNCIGGKLKSRILHITCNSNSGSDIDAKAFKELEFFTNFLNTPRDRKENQDITLKIDGKEVRRSADGNLHYISIKKDEEGNLKIHLFHSPNSPQKQTQINQAKKHIRNIGNKKGLLPDRIEEIVKKFESEIESKSETINNPQFTTNFAFNKDGLLFLGLLKIAIGYAVYSGCEKKDLEKSIKILKEKNCTENHKNIAWHYPNNLYPKDSIYHSLILIGDGKKKLLYCLISLYGVINVFVMLNNCYEGKNFSKNYFQDLRNHEVRENSTKIFASINPDEVLSTDKEYYSSLKQALSEFMDFFVTYPIDSIYEEIQTKYATTISEIAAESKIILSQEEFRTKFSNKFSYNISALKELKVLKKSQIEELVKSYHNDSNGEGYKSYLEIFLPQIVLSLIDEIWNNITFKNYEIIKDKEKFKSAVFEKFTSIKTDNNAVNLILKERHQEIIKRMEESIDNCWEDLTRDVYLITR